MKRLAVKNIGKEQYDVGEKIIGPNAIEVEMDGYVFQFPEAAAIKGEIDRSEKIKIPIKTKLIQYFIR